MIRDAIEALQKLEEATVPDANVTAYTKLTAEANFKVGEVSRVLKDGDLLEELKSASTAYSDYQWLRADSSPGLGYPIMPGTNMYNLLVNKYKVSANAKGLSLSEAYSAIHLKARGHLISANNMFSFYKENQK